ncbi:MAG: response regulator transcription factor, partial [Elusimicrobiota bacterium]
AEQYKPDTIILDVNLPDTDGWELCRRLKQNPVTENIPVVLYTGKAVSPEEQVRGLDAGAEDYIVKGTDNDIVLSRVNKAVTRGKQGVMLTYKRGGYELSAMPLGVKIGDRFIELTLKEFKFIHLLLNNYGEVVSRTELYKSLFNCEESIGKKTRCLEILVRRVRVKLGIKTNDDSIETVIEKGYRLK